MEAKVAKAFANWCWALGIIVYSILSKVLVKSSRYYWLGFRCSSFTFHNLCAWAITKVESSKTFAYFTPNFWRASIPTIQASYFAMLLVALKFNLTAKGMWEPSGVIKSFPIPFPYWFTAPSKHIFHSPSSMSKISSSKKYSLPSFPFIGFLTQKSDMALPLMVFLANYFKSNSTNRINHLDSLPLKEGF